MEHEGRFCLPFELKVKPEDEIKVVWDFDNEEYVILAANGDMDVLLHEDGTWRKPCPHALAEAWATVKSMNRRHEEGRQQRRARCNSG